MSKTIRTAAWLPADEDVSVSVRYRALRFPEHWSFSPLPLWEAGRPERPEPARTVPTRRMDQALQALAPGLIVLPRPYRDPDASPHWLLVPDDTEALTDTAFRTLRNAWLADLCPSASTDPEHRALLREVRGALDVEPPPWETVELELLSCPTTDGGTAALLHHQSTLATDWIARQIMALGPFESETGRLEFRPIPGGADRGAALLVSQPLPYEGKDRTSWYSVYLRITLQTEPFDPLPRFHLHTGIRRWATRTSPTTGRLRVPYGSRTTVLLRPKVPWLTGAPLAERFAVARLQRRPDPETGEWTDGWMAGGPAGLLRGISLSEPFPDADAILTDPELWLTDGMRAAVVHRTAMGRHPVLPGLMPDERSEIMAWAEQALPAELCPMPARKATSLGSSTPRNGRTRKQAEGRELDAARSRAVAAYAMSFLRTGRPETGPQVLEVRLLWQTELMRDTAVRKLAEQLGLGEPKKRPTSNEYEEARPGSAAVVEWVTPELTVRLRCLKLTDGLAGDLPIPEGAERKKKDAQRTAIATRRDKAAAFLRADRPGPDPTLALVELDRREAFTSGDHDPKFALRLGFANAGVLSQFAGVPVKEGRYDSVKNIDHRVAKAWDDGLRQLGARLLPEPDLPDGALPAGLRYAAVWLVRRTRRSRTGWAGVVPLAVRVTPEPTDPGLAQIEGWCPDADRGAGGWLPYPRALLRLTQRTDVLVESADDEPRPPDWRERDEQRRAVQEWLQVVYRSLGHDPILLMIHAQNIRTFWPWVQDGVVERDRIRLGHAPSRPLHPGVRVLRVRTSDNRGETAQWWAAAKPGQANGFAVHLWVREASAGRVFWSTTAKPQQFKTAKGIRKVGPNANKLAWNPDLVELAVLGCHPDDEPEALALAAHHLRQPPEYDQDLRLPLPLHLAHLAEEYILPLDDENEPLVEEPEEDPSASLSP